MMKIALSGMTIISISFKALEFGEKLTDTEMKARLK